MASLCEQCDTPKIRSRRFAPYHEFFSDKLNLLYAASWNNPFSTT